MAMEQAAARTPEREAFYDRIGAYNMAPLWERLHGLVTAQPTTPCLPAIWRYREIRPYLMQSGGLFAGLQLILPGEVAPSHRHTQSALRFIIEGEGAYTAVDGERTTMRPGDFVITPSWTWHDHGNETKEPMVWLDGLDLALVDLLNAVFFEAYGEDRFPAGRPEGDSVARFGSGLLPVDYERRGLTSPILNYTYERTREALERMSRGSERDRCHGFKMRYVHPA